MAYWQWDQEELEEVNPYPLGTLRFLDAQARETCDSPVDVGYPYFSETLAWTRGGDVVAVTEDGRIARFTPCEDAIPPRFFELTELANSIKGGPLTPLLVRDGNGEVRTFTVDTSSEWFWVTGRSTSFGLDIEEGFIFPFPGTPLAASYSPDGRSAAVSEEITGSSNLIRTSIVDLGTTLEVASVTWEYLPALGMGSPSLWLNNEDLLIFVQIIGGPLILNLKGEVVRVDLEFVGRDCSDRICYAFAARGASDLDYHIAIQDPETQLPPRLLLYHSHEAMAEELDYVEWMWFSPSGESIAGRFQDGSGWMSLWLRRVDPLGSTPTVFEIDQPLDGSVVPVTWSPESSMVSFAVKTGVGVARLEPDPAMSIWSTGEYSPVGVLWSPDGSYLALEAYILDSGGKPLEGMFLIEPD